MVDLPVAPALSLDRLGFRAVEEGFGATVNFVMRAPVPPHLIYMALCNRAHQPSKGWAPPIRALIKGLIAHWAY